MADDLTLNPGAGGDTVATDEVAGRHFQKQKIVVGIDGAEPVSIDADGMGMPQLINSKSFQGATVIPVYGFLTEDGLTPTPISPGPSNANGNRDFSDTGEGITYFYFKPPAGFIAKLVRLIVTIRDTGSLDAASYGNNITLTNGIRVLFAQSADPNAGPPTVTFDLTAGLNIFGNADWGRYTVDQQFSSFGAGDEYMSMRWDSSTTNRAQQFDGALLDGDLDDWVGVELHDDLGGLVQHLFFIQGVLIDKSILP